jgi:hypothetical protein
MVDYRVVKSGTPRCPSNGENQDTSVSEHASKSHSTLDSG